MLGWRGASSRNNHVARTCVSNCPGMAWASSERSVLLLPSAPTSRSYDTSTAAPTVDVVPPTAVPTAVPPRAAPAPPAPAADAIVMAGSAALRDAVDALAAAAAAVLAAGWKVARLAIRSSDSSGQSKWNVTRWL